MAYRRGWILVVLLSLNTISFIDRITLSVAAKNVAADYHLSPVQIGFLFSSFLWPYVLCLLPVGMLVDRFGVKKVSAAGIGLWCLATFLTAGTWNFASLLATRLLLGVGESPTLPAAARIVREWMPATERATSFTLFSAGTFAGPAIGAVVVGSLSSAYGWRAAFIGVGLLSLIWGVAFLIWYDRPEKARWLSQTELDHIVATRDPAESELEDAASSTYSIGLSELLATASVWGLIITQATLVYALYLLLFWLPSYIQSAKGLSVMTTGLFTAVPYAIAVPLSILVGLLSDKLLSRKGIFAGRRRVGVVIMTIVSAVVLLVPFVQTTWGLALLFTVSLTGIASGLSLNTVLVSDLLFDPKAVGKATSLVALAGNLFGIAAPIITGYVIARLGGYNWAFAIAGVLLLIGALACFVMTRRPIVGRKRTLEQAIAARPI